jgi:hypothetical protein
MLPLWCTTGGKCCFAWWAAGRSDREITQRKGFVMEIDFGYIIKKAFRDFIVTFAGASIWNGAELPGWEQVGIAGLAALSVAAYRLIRETGILDMVPDERGG